jgi:hypothetical protein
MNTDTKYYQYIVLLILCNISQIATGVPYSESPRKKSQSATTLVNIGCNLTCFRPVQSVDLLGWGSMSLGCSQKLLKSVAYLIASTVARAMLNS